MKISTKICSLFAVAGLIFSSCSKMNEPPTFDDKDACVAFDVSSLSFDENAGTVTIPVTMRTLHGFTTSVSYRVVDGSAKSGENFNVLGSSLNFTPSDPIQNIQVQIIDQPGLFTGDLSFSIELDNAGAVALGAEKKITVTINDLDHPLTPILGTWSASGESYYDGPTDWTVTLTKDASDISKVWISNFIAYGSSSSTPIFGIVDEDMTEIRIPVNQVIMIDSRFKIIRLEGSYGPDGEEYIPDNGFVTVTISADRRFMLILDEVYSCAYFDEAATDYAGDFNAFAAEIELIKD
ncbi:MAG: hypothetical protein FWG54_04845 [Bacteroidetes bacterium]|nr:hypothetical protein [Bacteroidota bacterium]